jgi:hypothetical protein
MWCRPGRTRGSARHVERQRNISFFEAFSIWRSFAYAQDDGTDFLCSNDKESNNKNLRGSSPLNMKNNLSIQLKMFSPLNNQ